MDQFLKWEALKLANKKVKNELLTQLINDYESIVNHKINLKKLDNNKVNFKRNFNKMKEMLDYPQNPYFLLQKNGKLKPVFIVSINSDKTYGNIWLIKDREFIVSKLDKVIRENIQIKMTNLKEQKVKKNHLKIENIRKKQKTDFGNYNKWLDHQRK